MTPRATLVVTALLGLVAHAPLSAGTETTTTGLGYDALTSLTRQLAFDPDRFFPGALIAPYITVRYTGDDYGYPVYSLAVYRGCTDADVGEARKTCGRRVVARMVRTPDPLSPSGERARPRARGLALFRQLGQQRPADEGALRSAIDGYGLEWLEADLTACPAAQAHMASGQGISFFAEPLSAQAQELEIVLHADKIDLAFGGYLNRTRYVGYVKNGSPGAWADGLMRSLEECWKPASATAPWLLPTPPEPEIDPPS